VIQAIVLLGLEKVVLPLFVWVPLAAALAIVVGAIALRRVRARLAAHGRSTRAATVVLGPLVLVVLPLGAGALGASFSLHRSVGALIDAGGREIVGFCSGRGGAALLLGVSPHQQLPTAQIHALLRAQLEGTRAQSLPAAQIGHPLVVLDALPQLLEWSYWKAADTALASMGDPVTLQDLGARTEELLATPANAVAREASARFYQAARLNAALLLAMLLVVHGTLLLGVHGYCGRLKVNA
jgi:hypothetical protein